MAWCPQSKMIGEWIQVSSWEPSMWTDIIIQGQGDRNQWVTSFKVAYTLNGHEWQLADNGKIYQGSFNRSSKRRITFDNPILARAVRIFPQTWHGFPCLRFDAIYV